MMVIDVPERIKNYMKRYRQFKGTKYRCSTKLTGSTSVLVAKAKIGTAWINPMPQDVNIYGAHARRDSLWMSEDVTAYERNREYCFRLTKDPRPTPLVSLAQHPQISKSEPNIRARNVIPQMASVLRIGYRMLR